MKYLSALLLVLLTFFPVLAEKDVFLETAIYYFTTNENVTLSFTCSENADDYEVYLYSLDRKEYNLKRIVTAEEGATEVSTIIQLPKTGFYKIMIRSRRLLTSDFKIYVDQKTTKEELYTYIKYGCTVGNWWNDSLTLDELKALAKQETHTCSPFIDSTNKETSLVIDHNLNETYNRSWVLYGYPAPPTAGGITQ